MQNYKETEYKEKSLLDPIPVIAVSPSQIPQLVSDDYSEQDSLQSVKSVATVMPIANNTQSDAPQTIESGRLKTLIDEAAAAAPFTSPYEAQQEAASSAYIDWSQQEYSSILTGEIENLLNDYMSRTFSYDPSADTAFKQASHEISRQIMEHMNSRGILPSTITQDRMGSALSSLIPEYERLAYDRFIEDGKRIMNSIDTLMKMEKDEYGRYLDEGERLYKSAQYIAGLSDSAYEKWKDARDERQQVIENQFKYEEAENKRQREAVADAWERVRELGYVDNQSSIILGVPAGTLSKDAQKAKDDLEAFYEKEAFKQQQELELITARTEAEKELIHLREEYKAAAEAAKSEPKAQEIPQPVESAPAEDDRPLFTAAPDPGVLPKLQPLTPDGKIMSENDLLFDKYYAEASDVLNKKGISQAVKYVNNLKLPKDVEDKIIKALKQK